MEERKEKLVKLAPEIIKIVKTMGKHSWVEAWVHQLIDGKVERVKMQIRKENKNIPAELFKNKK